MARHLIMVCRPRRQVPSLSYFQPIRIWGVPDYIILRGAFPCARPLSIAHHHVVHIAGLNQFSAFFHHLPFFLAPACELIPSVFLFLVLVGGGFFPHLCWRDILFIIYWQILKIKFVTFGGQIFSNQILHNIPKCWIASHACVFRGTRVGREEIRAPLKTPAWEAKCRMDVWNKRRSPADKRNP